MFRLQIYVYHVLYTNQKQCQRHKTSVQHVASELNISHLLNTELSIQLWCSWLYRQIVKIFNSIRSSPVCMCSCSFCHIEFVYTILYLTAGIVCVNKRWIDVVVFHPYCLCCKCHMAYGFPTIELLHCLKNQQHRHRRHIDIDNETI